MCLPLHTGSFGVSRVLFLVKTPFGYAVECLITACQRILNTRASCESAGVVFIVVVLCVCVCVLFLFLFLFFLLFCFVFALFLFCFV